MDAWTGCDFRSCNARAYKEIVFDSGVSLFMCNHHASESIPGLPRDVRFSLEPMSLGGYLGTDRLAHLDQDILLEV